MTEFQFRISQRAERDVQQIYDWLKRRSAAGARSWYERFREVVKGLAKNPHAYPEARESYRLRRPLREATVKTRYGRAYRAVFRVEGEEVLLLRVCGGEQRTLEAHDLDEA